MASSLRVGAQKSPVPCSDAGVAALVECSYSLRYQDPGASLAAARRAHSLASSGRIGDAARARAAAEAGCAARRFGLWEEAERLLGEAARLGRGNLAIEATVASYHGSLYSARRMWRAAHAALDRAETLFRTLDDPAGLARVAIKRGLAWIEGGRPERARPVLARAFATAPSAELQAFAGQSYVWAILESGNAAGAREALWIVEPVLVGDALYMQHVDWLRAKIALALGELDEARAGLEPLRSAFADVGLCQEAALVVLDLARVEAEAGRPLAVHLLAREAAPLFRALGLSGECCAARVFQQAAGGAVSAALFRKALHSIRSLPSCYRS